MQQEFDAIIQRLKEVDIAGEIIIKSKLREIAFPNYVFFYKICRYISHIIVLYQGLMCCGPHIVIHEQNNGSPFKLAEYNNFHH